MNAFACPHCAAPVSLASSRAGQRVVCPSCHRMVDVPAAPSRPGDDFRLEGETAGNRVVGKGIERVDLADDEDEDSFDGEPLQRPTMEWNLLLGGFLFPWTLGALGRWIIVALWAMAALWLGWSGARFGQGDMYSEIVGLLAKMGAVIFGAVCCAIAAINGLTILSETSSGNDRIESWPDLTLFLDWIMQVFYVINAATICVIIGMGVALLAPQQRPVAIGLTAFFLFPIFLLCELESDSAFLPVSALVFASLGRQALAWLLFYVEAAVLFAATGGVLYLLGHRIDSPPGVICASMLFSAATMIYFRLLGRLGYFCSQETDEEAVVGDEMPSHEM